jgi:soluble lytic murein transglycosylase
MQAAGALTQDEVWDRFRLALSESRINLAKSIVKRAKTFEAAQYKLIDRAYSSPSLLISKKLVSFKTRFGRELNLFALNRIAKTDSLQALSAFKSVEGLMLTEDKGYFYGKLALQAAQRQEPQALQWFKLVDDLDKDEVLNKDQLAWFVRAALREKNWPMVLKSVAKMSPEQAEEGAWRYWKARALAAQGQTLEANTLYAKLSTERHFYGWLAQDELADSISAPLNVYKVTDAEVSEIASTPAFQRAEALLRNDFRWEAKTEWAQATKGFDDKQLLAAAEFAARKNWYDLAIITADKTTETHNFALRYPAPYRNLMKPAARDQAIDEAWVYGITRQESRFVYSAKSNVGACGLMQLMPATARWCAKRTGMDYNSNMIHELDTNITLGTYYLRYTLDIFNGQEVMATAAYNAGPNRAKKWQATTPLEGAIYAETIPFSETRSYVQKVMANAHLYAYQLGLKSTSLKKRMGVIPSNLGGLVEDNPSPELVAEPVVELAKPIE